MDSNAYEATFPQAQNTEAPPKAVTIPQQHVFLCQH